MFGRRCLRTARKLSPWRGQRIGRELDPPPSQHFFSALRPASLHGNPIVSQVLIPRTIFAANAFSAALESIHHLLSVQKGTSDIEDRSLTNLLMYVFLHLFLQIILPWWLSHRATAYSETGNERVAGTARRGRPTPTDMSISSFLADLNSQYRTRQRSHLSSRFREKKKPLMKQDDQTGCNV